MKRNAKKGFTLIEIIVVIVVLAVLMAISIPAVLKYIDAADEAKYLTVMRGYMTDIQIATTKELVNQHVEEWTTFEEHIGERLQEVDVYTAMFGSSVIGTSDSSLEEYLKGEYRIVYIKYIATDDTGTVIADTINSTTIPSGNYNFSNGVTFKEYQITLYHNESKKQYIFSCIPNEKIELVEEK